MGTKIRELREKRKLTQSKLAKISGISRTTINQLEGNKKADVKTSTLNAIAKALEVPVAELC